MVVLTSVDCWRTRTGLLRSRTGLLRSRTGLLRSRIGLLGCSISRRARSCCIAGSRWVRILRWALACGASLTLLALLAYLASGTGRTKGSRCNHYNNDIIGYYTVRSKECFKPGFNNCNNIPVAIQICKDISYTHVTVILWLPDLSESVLA
jgi:hypothetical protein